MAERKELEKVIQEKVKPIIDEAMHKFLGITIDELSTDITDRLKHNPMVDLDIDISLPFRAARRVFRRRYIAKLLEANYGNVSKVASILGMDRRSIHRMIKSLNVDIGRYRKELMKPQYVKMTTIKGIIDATLDTYKSVIRPEKLEEAYKGTMALSSDILKELPAEPLSLKHAEAEFERSFLKKTVEVYKKNVSRAARKLGIRYETLHRKIKRLGI